MGLPIYKSGQYISLRFRRGVISGTDNDVIRTLTLSSDESATFKIIVKKGAGHDSGLVSYHMHDNVKVGDILEVSGNWNPNSLKKTRSGSRTIGGKAHGAVNSFDPHGRPSKLSL